MARISTLSDAISMGRRTDGSHIIPIGSYYLAKIAPISGKYARYIPDLKGSKGVCPLHDDFRPSFGIVEGRDGRERFNCFGCQSMGNVVDLHRRIVALHGGRQMGVNEAAKDLLNEFGIPLEDVQSLIVDPLDDLVDGKERVKSKRNVRHTMTQCRAAILTGIYQHEDKEYFDKILFSLLEEQGIARQ